MSHPDLQTYAIELPADPSDQDMEAFQEMMDAAQDETNKYIEAEAQKLGISVEGMCDIFYLRTRSRWTQEKEDYLVSLDQAGKPFPFMMDDFEVPTSKEEK